MPQTDNLRIKATHPLASPALLETELPMDDALARHIVASRASVRRVIHGEDARLMVIVGPCSVHDPQACSEYAERLAAVRDDYESQLLIVMRVYFEKPRTTIGWKGLINDPDLDRSFQINKGLRLARSFLLEVARLGLPAATEFLDTTLGQYYSDLISVGAIGARTTESQVHRELASGLSMPVGFKNRTDGDVAVARDAILSAAGSHSFPTLTKDGIPAILETAGNPDCFLILRGGAAGPNYSAESIAYAESVLGSIDPSPAIVVDCSHGNSQKDHARQAIVAADVAAQVRSGSTRIRGVMLESHLEPGNQSLSADLRYGQSITDACIGWEDTVRVLDTLAECVSS